ASRSTPRAEGLLPAPRAGDAGGRFGPGRGLLAARLLAALPRGGAAPAVPERPPAALRLPADAAADPGGVGRRVPGLRALPAAAHRLAPVRGRRRGQGLDDGRPGAGRGDDVLLPRLRLLPRGHRLFLAALDRRGVVLARRVPRGPALRAA